MVRNLHTLRVSDTPFNTVWELAFKHFDEKSKVSRPLFSSLREEFILTRSPFYQVQDPNITESGSEGLHRFARVLNGGHDMVMRRFLGLCNELGLTCPPLSKSWDLMTTS